MCIKLSKCYISLSSVSKFRDASSRTSNPSLLRCNNQGSAVCAQWLSPVWLFATCGLQSTRLLCPWDFPGKNTGVGCHFLQTGSSLPRDLKSISVFPALASTIREDSTLSPFLWGGGNLISARISLQVTKLLPVIMIWEFYFSFE